MAFLPISKKEMLERGWETCDFVYVIGDAYVDHPSFATPSSAGFWKQTATVSASSPSRTGRTPSPSTYSDGPGWAFWCPEATWIPW